MKNNSEIYNILAKKIDLFRKKKKRLKIFEGVIKSIFYLLPLFFFSIIFESLFFLPEIIRIVLLFLIIILSLLLAFFNIIIPLIHLLFLINKPDLILTAEEIGKYYKNVNDRLANALQIFKNFEKDKNKYSPRLVEAALLKVGDELVEENFLLNIDHKPLLALIKRALCVLLIFVTFCIPFHSTFYASFVRLTHPWKEFSTENKIDFIVIPGHVKIIKNENITIKTWLSDSLQKKVDLFVKGQSLEQQFILYKTSDDTFRYELKSVKESLQYFIASGKQKSQKFQITTIERPLLRNLQVKIFPPSYTGLNPIILDNDIGNLSAIKGSKVQISGEANKSLSKGIIKFERESEKPLSIVGTKIKGEFYVQKDDIYSIQLVDDEGIENDSPIKYRIQIIADNFPFVRIVQPGKDIDLGEDMYIPLAIEAQDDFGITNLQLVYQILPEGNIEIDSSLFIYYDIDNFPKEQVQINLAFDWDLSQMEMFPTDVLLYFVKVYDNDLTSGPKSAKSNIYRARFPSLYEMYEEVAYEQDDMTNAMEEAYQQSKELQQKVDEMAMEMKRVEEIDWQKKQELEEVLQKNKAISEQLENITSQMEQMIEKIEKNSLLSQETMQKYKELQDLFNEIKTPELEEVMEKLANAMQNLDENLLKQAMENLNFNLEDFNKSLERTISLLKKIKLEQQLDQAIKMAQDLSERQQKITENSSNPGDKQKIINEQQKISKDANALKDLLTDLIEEMQNEASMPADKINESLDKMESNNLESNLSQLVNMLQNSQFMQVPQKSTQVQQTFQEMAANLDQAKQMLSGEMQRKAFQAMKKQSQQLLQLSKKQEQLMLRTEGISNNSSQFPQVSDEQQQINSGMQRLIDSMYKAMNETFGVDRQLGQSLGSAKQNMEGAIQSLEGRNGNRASQQQGMAMSEMNNAVRQIQNSLQNMMNQNGSGGMSYQQFMNQMQQMAQSQMQINQQTQMLGMQGQYRLGQQGSVTRLAAEQNKLRKTMEDLAREAGGMSEILGSLDNIAEEMKKVEDDLNQKKIDNDTINRQNRILSRMLDAQKSINQREYSRERKAETGKTFIAKSPNALPDNLGENEDQLKQELLRAKREGYSRDYLELIRNYFEGISKDEGDE